MCQVILALTQNQFGGFVNFGGARETMTFRYDDNDKLCAVMMLRNREPNPHITKQETDITTSRFSFPHQAQRLASRFF